MLIPNPANATQRRFNKLCQLGGGLGGGPARSKVQLLLSRAGKAINEFAYAEVAEHLATYPNANPWHICFAIGLSWGHLAELHKEFTGAAVRLLANWNDEDLRLARQFALERGPSPIEQSLTGGYLLFQKVVLPTDIPGKVTDLSKAQNRWLGRILGPDRPPYIGSWNSTALFMVALFAKPLLASEVTDQSVLLPPGGPIYNGLSILHRANVLPQGPTSNELDDQAFEPASLSINNSLFHDLKRGFADWHILDVSIGAQKGPRIGVQKGPPWERLEPVVHRGDPRAA